MNIRKKKVRDWFKPGPKLYTEQLRPGLALGYRKSVSGGTWTARLYSGEGTRYLFCALGQADDATRADGVRVLTFDQAAEKAREWAKTEDAKRTGEIVPGAYSVKQAMADYLTASEAHKGKRLERTRYTIDRHINPQLGSRQLAALRHSHLTAWRDALIARKPSNDAEAIRRRRSTVNRVWTILRAGLNHAFKEGRVANDSAWARITPYKAVDAPKIRQIPVDVMTQLIEFCPSEFKPLLLAAIYTGCRYGEICALKVGDFNGSTIHIRHSKSGKPRFQPLTDEAKAFFAGVCNGRDAEEIMFIHTQGRHKGKPWTHSQQRHWMLASCEFAGIKPAISYHLVRHCYASHLAMNNVPMPVIAALLGHANGDLRMVTKHYAHLSDGYVSEQFKANFPSFKPATPLQGE